MSAGNLSALDESFQHQVALPFELAGPSDHRFFDRTVVTCGAPDGSAGAILGMAAYKNMNVMDGFGAIQIDRSRQLNLRMSRALRPQLEQVLGPLRIEIVEPFKAIRYVMEPGTGTFGFDFTFRAFLDPVLEDPHFHRIGGRITQDYVRFNQLMTVDGRIEVEGRTITADKWFGWRDHSWGVRPGVGGFEPPVPGVKSAFPSAARAGGKGMLLFYIGYNVEDELGGGIQIIEASDGARIYVTGHLGTKDQQSDVVDYDFSIETFPGTRAPKKVTVRAKTADGKTHEIVAEPNGQPWGYKGFGYDAGYDDGRGQGVWRSDQLHVEQDEYDISDVEEIKGPGGQTTRPAHREVHVTVTVDGRKGHGYMPFIAIGDVIQLER